MLMRYTFENFTSFNKPVEFSTIANKEKRLEDHYIESNGVKLLKNSVIYGPNASGKSNFVKSIDLAKKIIVEGVDRVNTFNKHYRLDELCQQKNTKFEFEVKCGGKFYAYGILIHLQSKTIHGEWLYELSKGKEKKILERQRTSDGKHEVELGIKFSNSDDKKRFDVYKLDLNDSLLFLKEINSKNLDGVKDIEPLIDVYNWFKKQLTIIYPGSTYAGLPSLIDDDKLSSVFLDYLCRFSTGIDGISSTEIDFEEEFSDMPEDIKLDITKMLQKGESIVIEIPKGQYSVSLNEDDQILGKKLGIEHQAKDGKTVSFDIKDESDGTQRLFDLIPAIHSLKNQKKVFIVDELDRSLHPLLTQGIMDLFTNLSEGIENQLIVTTHESSLLDLKKRRRDEVWFIDKEENSSKMYSLDEFKVRFDKEIRKGYLFGRYGAIPVFNNLEKERVEKGA